MQKFKNIQIFILLTPKHTDLCVGVTICSSLLDVLSMTVPGILWNVWCFKYIPDCDSDSTLIEYLSYVSFWRSESISLVWV